MKIRCEKSNKFTFEFYWTVFFQYFSNVDFSDCVILRLIEFLFVFDIAYFDIFSYALPASCSRWKRKAGRSKRERERGIGSCHAIGRCTSPIVVSSFQRAYKTLGSIPDTYDSSFASGTSAPFCARIEAQPCLVYIRTNARKRVLAKTFSRMCIYNLGG